MIPDIEPMNTDRNRIVIVSNRLPFTVHRQTGELARSSGGLVTAMEPVSARFLTHWVGWTGTEQDPKIEAAVSAQNTEWLRYVPVFMSKQDSDNFYRGFANEILWPLFHDLQSRCNFEPRYWESYCKVNREFARATMAAADGADLVWVHDYHLMLLGSLLRQSGLTKKLAFFLHIPFPAPDIFEKLPWSKQVLEALLQFDLVGFQTPRDQKNFINSAKHMGLSFKLHKTGAYVQIQHARTTAVGSFPISIDSQDWARAASAPPVQAKATRVRRDLAGQQIVLGIDRLDYTKGIPERLKAFETLLQKHPEHRRRITLLQVVVPSREDIPKYRELTQEVQQLVARINGQHGEPGWTPVHYVHRHLQRQQLLAYYAAADIALVTPLKDGMNLVAKEYCAAKQDGDGVLILSQFAGAAAELGRGAVLVNPYDREQVAEAIHRATGTSRPERQRKMRTLKDRVLQNDVFRWCEDILRATEAEIALKDKDGNHTTELQLAASATLVA